MFHVGDVVIHRDKFVRGRVVDVYVTGNIGDKANLPTRLYAVEWDGYDYREHGLTEGELFSKDEADRQQSPAKKIPEPV